MSEHHDDQADPKNGLYYQPYKGHAYEERYTDGSRLMRTLSTMPTFEQWRCGWACFPAVIATTRPDPVLCLTNVGWNAQARFGTRFSGSYKLNGMSNKEALLVLSAIGFAL